jgi:hypothetical protein
MIAIDGLRWWYVGHCSWFWIAWRLVCEPVKMPMHLTLFYLSKAIKMGANSALVMLRVSSWPEASIHVVVDVGEWIIEAPSRDLHFLGNRPYMYIRSVELWIGYHNLRFGGVGFGSRFGLYAGVRSGRLIALIGNSSSVERILFNELLFWVWIDDFLGTRRWCWHLFLVPRCKIVVILMDLGLPWPRASAP